VYSEEGIGTTFRVYLPAVVVAAAAPAEAVDVVVTGGGGETILVVEDDPSVLHVTSRILREHGYHVLEAEGFDEAVELATRHDFQLLLTDSVIPHGSGGSLAERVRALRPGRPVLYMSGYGDGVLGAQGVIPGDGELIQKPFSQKALLEKVRSLAEQAPR
jgi:DNA-binding response OmpR family regulator